jgi:hypothetical protein
MAERKGTTGNDAPSGAAQAGRTTKELIHEAAELADGLKQDLDRFYCLAATITEKLTPEPGEDPPSSTALRLAEVLEGLLLDASRINRLCECLAIH